MDDAYYIRLVEECLDDGSGDGPKDVLDYEFFVVYMMEDRKPFGAICGQLVRKYRGVEIPDLRRGDSSPPFTLSDGKRVIFSCLWKREEKGDGYDPHVIEACTASAIRMAHNAGIEELAMPLIGGSKKFDRMAYMGRAMHDALALIERRGEDPPEITVVLGRGKRRGR